MKNCHSNKNEKKKKYYLFRHLNHCHGDLPGNSLQFPKLFISIPIGFHEIF